MKNIFEKSKSIVENRAQKYGSSNKLLKKIADKWSATLGIPVTPEKVVICMIDLKTCRLTENIKDDDSLLDIMGYSALYDRLEHKGGDKGDNND